MAIYLECYRVNWALQHFSTSFLFKQEFNPFLVKWQFKPSNKTRTGLSILHLPWVLAQTTKQWFITRWCGQYTASVILITEKSVAISVSSIVKGQTQNLTTGTFLPPPFRGKTAAADSSVERKSIDVTRVTSRRWTTAVTGRGSHTQISIKDCAENFTKITDFFGTQRKVRLVRTSLCHKINMPLHRRDAAKETYGSLASP